jgi:hypothetical protein
LIAGTRRIRVSAPKRIRIKRMGTAASVSAWGALPGRLGSSEADL